MRRRRAEMKVTGNPNLVEPRNAAKTQQRVGEQQPLIQQDANERAAGNNRSLLPIGTDLNGILERRGLEPLRRGRQ